MSDYILREEAEQARPEFLNEIRDSTSDSEYARGWNAAVSEYRAAIRETVPAADVRPVVRGEWIDTQLDNFRKWESKCSACGWSGISDYDSYVDIYDFNYCPNCGADMRDKEGNKNAE